MKFVSTRELRNRPGAFRRTLREEDVVLTASGKPMALVLGIAEGEMEETLALVRQIRAQRALTRAQRTAREAGTHRMTPEEIEAEIRAARQARRDG